MNVESHQTNDSTEKPPSPSIARRIVRAIFMYLLPIGVVIGGATGAKYLYDTAPKAQRKPPAKQATLVEVEPIRSSESNAQVQVMGTVIAAKEVDLQPRVSGEIISLNPKFVPGGRFEKNEVILQIDPQDYELTIDKIQSQVVQAEYEYKLEQGQQEIAQHEWELLGNGEAASDLDRELVLRKPHLARAKANQEGAKAALREAQLDLERTTIRAPFNGIVTMESVDVGAQVTPQTKLGMLVGTDEYWVRAAVAVDELRWIRFPNSKGEGGSTALVEQHLGNDATNTWEGRVVKLLGDLEAKGRMARVLILVQDPLRLNANRKIEDKNGSSPLLMGAYVNVLIDGRSIKDVVAVPRTALRDHETVWVMTDEDRLDIREVTILHRDRESILVRSGVRVGERLVMSDIPAPVQGMALMVGAQEDDDSRSEVKAHELVEVNDDARTE